MTINQQDIGSLSFEQLADILSKSRDHLILKRFEPVEAYEGICLYMHYKNNCKTVFNLLNLGVKSPLKKY